MDDDDLVRAARDNEPYAGPFLVSVYGPRLAGYCRSIASDLSDTDREVVTAIGIERAVRRIERYEPARGPLLAWLRPFILHATQDWRRTNAHLSSYDLPDMADRAETVDPGLSTSTTQAIAAVRRAIPQLSPPDQIMIMLRNYEQRSVQDTAAILDITSDACRQRHLRALRRLKVILAADPHARRLMGDRE